MTSMIDEPSRQDIERDAAIEAVLAIVPPGLGGRDQAVFNLRTLPNDHLLRLRADLEASVERLGAPGHAPQAGSSERRDEAQAKLRSGLDRLKAAADSIRTSRAPENETRNGQV